VESGLSKSNDSDKGYHKVTRQLHPDDKCPSESSSDPSVIPEGKIGTVHLDDKGVHPPLLKSMSLDFVFGFPKDSEGNNGIVVFVDRLSKMAHLAAVLDTIDSEGTAKLFIDRVFRQHGLPVSTISERDPLHWEDLGRCLQGARHQVGHVHSGPSADRRSDGARESRCRRQPP